MPDTQIDELSGTWAHQMFEPVLEPQANLIPYTALPEAGPGQADQPEGRGTVTADRNIVAPSLFEKLATVDGISAAELAVATRALDAYDRAPARVRTFFPVATDITDGTTGNVVLPLFDVPAGMEGRISSLTVDTPASTTITPAAPFANASSWAFIAKAPPTSTDSDTAALVLSLRQGLVAFAPTSASGPIIPGQWTFTDDQAPVARGGESFYYVLVGGSVAAILALTVRAVARVNLYAVGAQ